MVHDKYITERADNPDDQFNEFVKFVTPELLMTIDYIITGQGFTFFFNQQKLT